MDGNLHTPVELVARKPGRISSRDVSRQKKRGGLCYTLIPQGSCGIKMTFNAHTYNIAVEKYQRHVVSHYLLRGGVTWAGGP
jgi:hypothetical protein